MNVVRSVLPAAYRLWSQEELPPDYRATVLRVPDFTNKLWQIDGLVTTGSEPFYPIAIVDPKYIQRTKWCFDKGGWLCTAHPRLRQTFATMRGSVALLAGRWSPDSLKVIEQHRIGIIRLPYEHIQTVMSSHGVDMGWKDEDSDWAAIPAFQAFERLSIEEKSTIPEELLRPIEKQLQEAVLTLLRDGPRILAHLDLELTTSLGEYLRLEAKTPNEVAALLEGMDIDALLKRHSRYFDVRTKQARSLESTASG